MALPDLAQDETNLLIENVGRPRRLDRSFRRSTPAHVSRPFPRHRLKRQMRVPDVRSLSELRHRAAKSYLSAFDDVGAVRDQPREMQVLLRNHDADAFPLHRE